MALSEMEMRAMQGTPYIHRVNARLAMNRRAVRMNQPLPNPADAIQGGVDPQIKTEIMETIHKLMETYGWDMSTAFRGMNNIIEDLGAANLG